jgi:hypothetical protein
MSDDASDAGPIAIIGADSIGVDFSIVCARTGFQVRVQDPNCPAAVPGKHATLHRAR